MWYVFECVCAAYALCLSASRWQDRCLSRPPFLPHGLVFVFIHFFYSFFFLMIVFFLSLLICLLCLFAVSSRQSTPDLGQVQRAGTVHTFSHTHIIMYTHTQNTFTHAFPSRAQTAPAKTGHTKQFTHKPSGCGGGWIRVR